MLNETASSTEDRPALRSPVRNYVDEDDARLIEIRDMVATVFVIERDIAHFDNDPQENIQALLRHNIMPMTENARLMASFEGRLLGDSEAAYDRLDALMKPLNYLPVFREDGGKQVVHVLSGRAEPKPRSWTLNAILFLITVFSVLWLGAQMALNEIAAVEGLEYAQTLAEDMLAQLWRGLPYAVSILLILGSHELGHYFAARRHRLAVTLPYFIPAPFISFLGTFGAAIQLREPMRNRKVLLDVGAAGPLVGLVFAIPILFIGLATSRVGPIQPGGVLEGNSLLYALAKTIVFGRFLPDGQVDVYLNQMAMAGWAGLLVTMFNLIPLGQLDGGHILYSLVGNVARRLYYPLLGVVLVLAFINQTWLIWLVLLFLVGRVYAVPLDTITPLDRRRRWIALLALVVFVVIFVPTPLTQVEAGTRTPLPRNSVEWLPYLTAAIIVGYQRLRR